MYIIIYEYIHGNIHNIKDSVGYLVMICNKWLLKGDRDRDRRGDDRRARAQAGDGRLFGQGYQ